MEALPLAHSDEFLAIARFVRPQGRKGEVAAEILTDFPERFAKLSRAYLENPGTEPEPVRVEHAWLHQGRVILKLSGVNSIDQAERLRGRHLLVPKGERAPLPSGRYYIADLVGCRVVRRPAAGPEQEIGLVTEVEATGGVDLLHVAPSRTAGVRPAVQQQKAESGRRSGATRGPTAGNEKEDILIPLARAICIQIDPEARLIVVDPPQDLLELNRES